MLSFASFTWRRILCIRHYCKNTATKLRVSEAISGSNLGANIKVQVRMTCSCLVWCISCKLQQTNGQEAIESWILLKQQGRTWWNVVFSCLCRDGFALFGPRRKTSFFMWMTGALCSRCRLLPVQTWMARKYLHVHSCTQEFTFTSGPPQYSKEKNWQAFVVLKWGRSPLAVPLKSLVSWSKVPAKSSLWNWKQTKSALLENATQWYGK